MLIGFHFPSFNHHYFTLTYASQNDFCIQWTETTDLEDLSIAHQYKVNHCIQTITAMVFRSHSHLTDHKIKPSTVARVSMGQVADSAFIAAANEKEGSDKYKLTFKGS